MMRHVIHTVADLQRLIRTFEDPNTDVIMADGSTVVVDIKTWADGSSLVIVTDEVDDED